MHSSPNAPVQNIASNVDNEELISLNEPSQVKVVLPDECGDTLWDKVLEQEDGVVETELPVKNKDLLRRSDFTETQ